MLASKEVEIEGDGVNYNLRITTERL